jgi:predicted MFS family arabinose efflux permease
MTDSTRSGVTFSGAYKGWALAILLIVYTSNFIDRTIVAVLAEPIKTELGLQDWQLGLLTGLSFALFYTLMGVPIARIAERSSRVNLITVSLGLWSAFTAACGVAQTYWQLLLFRVGVGVGEAGCSPAAHSLISDYFEPRRRATALSVYSLGIPLGTLIGAVAGGWVAKNLDWRIAFLVVGLPGVLLAVVVKFCLKEPPRGYSEPDRPPSPEAPPLKAVWGYLLRQPAFVHLAVGSGLVSFCGYGMGAFTPPYLARAFGFDAFQAGLVWGLVGGVAAGIGTLLGGPLSDLLGRRDARWYARLPAIGLIIATPLYIAAFLQTDPRVAIPLLMIPPIFHYLYLGPTFGVAQSMVEPRMRASTTALLFLILNLIGNGLGPSLVGLAMDIIATRQFAGLGLGDFAQACPGGRAAAGAAPALADACRTSLVTGTRGAMVGCCLIFLWAAVHYLLAARSIRQALSGRAGAGLGNARPRPDVGVADGVPE